jgi:hypothetical protein
MKDKKMFVFFMKINDEKKAAIVKERAQIMEKELSEM